MKKNWRKNILYDNARTVIKYFKSNISREKRVKNKEINMVFLCSRANVWNSVKSVYDSAVKSENIKVYLIALPPYKNGELDTESNINYEFCKKNNPETIQAYNRETGEYFDIRKLSPDYIVYPTPYSVEFPECYSFKNTSKISKLCYISYGYSLVKSKMQKITVMPEIMSYVSYIFVCNNIIYNYYKKRMFLSEMINGKRLYNIGFPRFDLYKNISLEKKNNKTTIMWMPRWTTLLDEKKDGNEPSSFFEVKDEILRYTDENPNINLIIRPHPKAFENYVKHGMMTLDEVNDYKKRIGQMSNAILDDDPDYYGKLISADVLVADFTSVIAEFFVTGKPIVYLGNGNNYPREHRVMYNSFYHADSWKSAERTLNALIDGNDTKKQQRVKAVKDFIKRKPKNVGQHIIEILTRDYYKK